MNAPNFRRVFLDSSPVIYLVEKHPLYFAAVQPIFVRADTNAIELVTSPVTLAECLIFPIRNGNIKLAQDFERLISRSAKTSFVVTNENIAKKAAELRVQYGLKLPDALQIATALFANCDAFLTNDTGLRRVQGIHILVVDDLLQNLNQ